MRIISITLSLLAIFLLSAGGLVGASGFGSNQHDWQQHSTQQVQLSLGMTGKVVNAGSQTYFVQQSGPAISASLAGYNIDPSQPIQLTYLLTAYVNGLSASGGVTFNLKASLAGGGTISISGLGRIVGEVPVICFPSYSSGSCASGDTSSIPAFFISGPDTMITVISNVNHQVSTQTMKAPMLFESAYLNPFQAPIVFGTADSFATFLVVTSYSRAMVNWNGVVTAALLSGTYGQTPVSGNANQMINERENLVTGTTVDSGTMAFSNVVDNNNNPIQALDTTVTFKGNSSTPTSNAIDCSFMLGLPPGLCTEYGFSSSGTFNSAGQGSTMSGSYFTGWTIPAFGFFASTSGTVTVSVPQTAQAFPTTTEVTCTQFPNNHHSQQGNFFTCTASVTGSSPSGTVTFSSSSTSGSFNPNSCHLEHDGTCFVRYVDSAVGSTITASYNGDQQNSPSSGTTTISIAE